MKSKRVITTSIAAIATLAVLTGVAVALVQVTRNVDATVDVQVIAPEGIEIYLDAALTQVAGTVEFGSVDVDPFGKLLNELSVPVWVKNVSISGIRLSLSDDLDGADVIFVGEEQNPIIGAGEVLPGALSLHFTEPDDGEFDFILTFQAEGPVFAEPVLTIPPYWNPPIDFYGQPVYGGQIRINYEDPLVHANTWGAYAGLTSRYRIPTMNSLVEEDTYQPGSIIPDLAKDWVQEPDLTGFTFNFEDGVKWHNGDDFTCEDARFTIQTMITGEGITAPEMAGKLSNVDLDATSCLDDQTLEIGFKGQSATGLLPFVDRAFLIFNKEWFLAGGENAMFNDVSVGTGPYRWAEGQSVGVDEQLFERNPDYFKPGLPYTDSIKLFGILDESTQQASMLAHLTDWHWVRNFGQYNTYVDHDQLQTVIRATRGHHSIWLNKGNPPLDNVKVRQAIYMGIDRSAAISVLLQGHGSEGFIMPPGGPWDLTQEQGCAIPAWCEPEGGVAAQRAEAISILEGEDFDFDKIFIFTVEDDEQVWARASFIGSQLSFLGIIIVFDIVEANAYRAKTADGTWGDILNRNDTMPADDPALGMGFYMRCVSPNNHWTPQTPCDDFAEDLLDQLETTVDPDERKALSDELQLYAMEQYWKFPLYWEQEAVAFWPEVRGYVHQPQPAGSFLRWEQLWYDPAHLGDTGFSGQTTGVPGEQ